MDWIKNWWAILLISVFVPAAVLGVILWMNRHPSVNQAQAKAIQPAVDAYMHDHGMQMGLEGALDSKLKPQLFCAANIVEIRPDGPRWRVGMMTNCGEYARQGRTLVEASIGYDIAVAEVVIPARSKYYKVLSFEFGPDGYAPDWVHQNFSPVAARWMLSGTPPTAPDPISQARQAFGFPAGAAAVQE